MDEMVEIRGESAKKSANGVIFTHVYSEFSHVAVQCTAPLDSAGPDPYARVGCYSVRGNPVSSGVLYGVHHPADEFTKSRSMCTP